GEMTTNGGTNVDGIFSLREHLILFADGDANERGLAYVNSIQIWDGKLTDLEVSALGGPSARGIPLPYVITSIIRTGSNLTISWNSRPGVTLQTKANLSDAVWQDVAGS